LNVCQNNLQPNHHSQTFQNLLPYRRFTQNNFLAEAAAAVDQAAVLQTLDWIGEDTKWTYRGLKSAIFCFQTRCRSTTHPFQPSLLVPEQRIAKLSRRDRATGYKLYLDNWRQKWQSHWVLHPSRRSTTFLWQNVSCTIFCATFNKVSKQTPRTARGQFLNEEIEKFWFSNVAEEAFVSRFFACIDLKWPLTPTESFVLCINRCRRRRGQCQVVRSQRKNCLRKLQGHLPPARGRIRRGSATKKGRQKKHPRCRRQDSHVQEAKVRFAKISLPQCSKKLTLKQGQEKTTYSDRLYFNWSKIECRQKWRRIGA